LFLILVIPEQQNYITAKSEEETHRSWCSFSLY